MTSRAPPAHYDGIFQAFDSDLMARFRRAAYGTDFGQHSWVDESELQVAAAALRLGSEARLLDLGCGACGPLTWLMATTGCRGTGLELSPAAVRSGHDRAACLQLQGRFSAGVADLNQPLPAQSGSFDAVLAIDVVLHLKDRANLFAEVRRVLRPGGRFLFTDAAVLTGAVSSAEIARRSAHAPCQFVPAGWNERLLGPAGLTLVEQQDTTPAVVAAAGGRLGALHSMRTELEASWGAAEWESQVDYVTAVHALAERGAVSRWRYLVESIA